MERADQRHRSTHPAPPMYGASRLLRRGLPVLVLGLAAAGAVHAIGLDAISQQSGLGEPLRLVIPVLSNASDQAAGDEFAGECFKLVAPAAGDLPQLNSARLSLQHQGGRAFVVLTTAYPINEPIMRLAVQAGCRVSVSREYTVLLDPIVIDTPIAEKATQAPAVVAAAAAATAEPVAARPPAAVAVTVPESETARPRIAANRKPGAGVAPGRQDGIVNRAGRAVASTPPTTRVAKAQPRLQVSRTIVDTPGAPVGAAGPNPAAEREALRTIEEQTVVLQRQIAELSIAMERMQQELVAARAAKAEAEKNARLATEQGAAAAVSPWVAIRAWGGVNWPLLVLIPALLVLIAAALHRRRPLTVPAPITPAQAAAFNRADLGEPSLPGPEPLPAFDREAVAAPTPIKTKPRMIAGAFVEPPPAAEFKYDPGLAFDDEVRQTAEATSAYSALEREQPGIIGRLTDSWGTPRAAAQVENYLLTPRRGGRSLSGSAIEELKLLRSIALDHAGSSGGMVPRAREGNGQLRLSGS